jgi:hypothetical protein
MSFRQTEAFQELDRTGQNIVEILLESREGVTNAIQDHTVTVERLHNDTIDCMATSFAAASLELAASSSRHDGQHAQIINHIKDSASKAKVDQEEQHSKITQLIDNSATRAKLENAIEHSDTRNVISSRYTAIEERLIAEHMETRAAIANSGADGIAILERLTDHILVLQQELHREHAIERERTREELMPWITALMVQNARVIEAQQAAVDAAARTTSSRNPSKAEALKRAQQVLEKAIQILIDVVKIFEKVCIPLTLC